MPDSQVPPLWGPAYDERALEALLSGETGGTPVALQPVESALAALRAAATRRELSDEAAARAAYRAFARGPLTPPTLTPPTLTPPTQPQAAAERHADITAHTLVLSPADHREDPAARHGHRRPRRAAGGARRPGISVTGAAAAALIAAVVVTVALTGSIGRLTSFGRHPASASARATGQTPGSQGLLATGAARDRTPSPKTTAGTSPATRSTSDPGSQCRAYYDHRRQGGPADWISLRGQLAGQAGSPFKIHEYCRRYLDNRLAGRGASPSPWTTAGGFGSEGGNNPGFGSLGTGSQGNQGSAATEQGQGGHPAAVVGRP